jgi:hypothetical protein
MFMPRAISQSVDRVARAAAGKDWNLYAALLDHWTEIVGADYARVTTPVKLTFPHQPNEAKRSNGTLCIRLPKGLAMEFSFKSDVIIQRVNRYFGHAAISRISYEPVYETIQPPRSAREPDPQTLEKITTVTASIDDPDLRNALESFGIAVVKAQNNS